MPLQHSDQMDILSPAEPLSCPGEDNWQEGALASGGASLLMQRWPTAQEASLSVPLGRPPRTPQRGGPPGSVTEASQMSRRALERGSHSPAPVPPLTGCVTSSQSLTLSGPRLSHEAVGQDDL